MAPGLTWGEPPPSPPAELGRFVGLYGRRARRLDVFEEGGGLFAQGCGFARAPLGPHGGAPLATGTSAADVRLYAGDGAPFAMVGDERLDWRDFDREAAALALRAPDPAPAGAVPPTARQESRLANDLVNIAAVDPSVRLDIRYATADNFMGFALYPLAAAYLQRPAAEALARVQRVVRSRGYGLIVHDAYRPWSITKLFWDAVPPAFRAFVADPAVGSRHNRGCAVDVGLCEANTNRVVEMPSRYDEASERSYADFGGGTARQRWFRDRLGEAMAAEGFTVQPEEWWHFDFEAWPDYAVSDISLTELDRRDRAGPGR